MRSTTRRSLRCWMLLACVMAMVLMVIPSMAGGVKYEYSTKVVGPSDQLDAVTGGTPAWAHYDRTGYNLLVWGHEGPNDVRLLGRDLQTRKVLDIPAGFTVEGVAWGDFSDRIVVWGSPGAGLNDTLVFYQSPSWDVEDDFIPQGLIPLVEIDSAQFFAADLIFSVAGRDANGSSRIIVVQTEQDVIIRNDPVPDDRTVVHIGNDGRFMAILDDQGRLIVYVTTDWTFLREFDLLSAPFSSYFIEDGNVDRIIGGRDGTIKTQFGLNEDMWMTLESGTGPVLGVFFANQDESYGGDYLISAVPGEGSGSVLQVWDPKGGSNWTLVKGFDIDGRVSMLARDPRENLTIVVGFDDGSVSMYDLVVTRHEISDKPGDWWVPLVMIPLTIIVLALIGYGLFRRTKGRGGG